MHDHVVARRPRTQVPGGTYHVIGRGCRGQPILDTSEDREHFLFLLEDAVSRCEWQVLDWTLMTNHYHLALTLRDANLSEGMHRVHSLFGQRWNERHDSMGHVFFRRFASVEVRSSDQLARLMLYIDLNPVRAGLCAHPSQWEWGGYSANVGIRTSLPFHDPDAGVRSLVSGNDEPAALRLHYARRVTRKAHQVRNRGKSSDERPALDEILVRSDDLSLLAASELWGYSMAAIADYLAWSESSVRRRIAAARADRDG